jgi:hypothetical protein
VSLTQIEFLSHSKPGDSLGEVLCDDTCKKGGLMSSISLDSSVMMESGLVLESLCCRILNVGRS